MPLSITILLVLFFYHTNAILVSPEQVACQLTRVLLGSGDSMKFNLEMHILPENETFSSFTISSSPSSQFISSLHLKAMTPSNPVYASTMNTTCYWIIVARMDESTPWDSIKTPSVEQIQKGLDSSSKISAMYGSISGLNTIFMQQGSSSDFGQIMFVVVTTEDGSNEKRVSVPRRLLMPRRCRYRHDAVIVPAGWRFKTNMTRNLADFGVASLPQAAPASKNADASAASLASHLYISGGTYDSSQSWRDPLSGTFKATGYWVDPIHSGRSFKYFPNTYNTYSAMLMEAFPKTNRVAGRTSIMTSIGGIDDDSTSSSSRIPPTLIRTQRRLFGMTATMQEKDDIRFIFHLGGINEIDGILKRTDLLRISASDGSDGYWDTLDKSWDLKIARHSIAATSWVNPMTNQIHLYVVGGNTENGATLNSIEMLIVREPIYLKTEYIENGPFKPFHILNGTLLVPRSRASAVVVNNYMYVIGGELALLGEVERCSLIDGCQSFHLIAPLRKPRYAGSAIWSSEMNEILYIGGFRVGQYCDYNEQCTDDAPTYVNLVAGPSNDVESYHIETDSWNPRAKLQVARYGLEVAEIVIPNEGYNDKSGDNDVYAKLPMRQQIVAMGGIGGLVWNKQTPMTPRRLSTVEVFSCYQYSESSRNFISISFAAVLTFVITTLALR